MTSTNDYRKVEAIKQLKEIFDNCRHWGCYRDVRDACVKFLERNDVITEFYPDLEKEERNVS